MHKRVACVGFEGRATEISVFTGSRYVVSTEILDTGDRPILKGLIMKYNVKLCLLLKSPESAACRHLMEALTEFKIIAAPKKKQKEAGRCLEALRKYMGHSMFIRTSGGVVYGYCGAVPVYQENMGKSMLLSYQTLVGLDIMKKQACCATGSALGNHTKKSLQPDSVFKEVDFTITVPGRDTLRMWMSSPLKNADEVYERHRLQMELRPVRKAIVEKLKHCRCGPIGTPTTTEALSTTIRSAFSIYKTIDFRIKLRNKKNYALLLNSLEIIKENKIQDGCDREVDRLRKAIQELPEHLNAVAHEISNKSRKALKVVYFPQLGYLVESAAEFEDRRFTIQNKGYYKTKEMTVLDEVLGDVETELQNRERQLINELIYEVQNADLSFLADFIGTIDALCSMILCAEAIEGNAPNFTENEIIKVGASSRGQGRERRTDNCKGGLKCAKRSKGQIEGRLMLLENSAISKASIFCGGNAALQAVGQLVILAQCGFFLPFKTVELPIFDAVLLKPIQKEVPRENQSTFLAEVVCLENLLLQATPKTLCLIDDIGHGTNFWDGASLFLSTCQFIRPRILLACTAFPLQDILLDANPAFCGWISLFSFFHFSDALPCIKEGLEQPNEELEMKGFLEDFRHRVIAARKRINRKDGEE